MPEWKGFSKVKQQRQEKDLKKQQEKDLRRQEKEQKREQDKEQKQDEEDSSGVCATQTAVAAPKKRKVADILRCVSNA